LKEKGDAYYGYLGYNLLERPIKKKKNDIWVSAYISNCVYRVSTDRLKIIQELKKYVNIDVFGKCFNTSEPKELMHLDIAKRKIENIANYKFHLAFENSRHDGYISEKIWQSFYAGTVPIYLGAPNIRNYLPRQNSALIVDEFASVKELADEIKRLAKDDEEYDKMHEWRKRVDDSFLNVMDYECLRTSCKICHLVADSLDRDRVRKLHSEKFHLYIRPFSMYRFIAFYPTQPMTLDSLLKELYEKFKNHQPRWQYCMTKYFREFHEIEDFRVKISKIVKKDLTYHQKMFEDGIDSDEKVKNLKSGEELEIIFA
jgi:hypothetical protein